MFEASDGAQAVEKFADIVPDVTFMDIVMPELGVEALKLIKTNSPDAVVIMATSVGTVGNLSEAIKLGANDFLQKPVDEEQLYKLLDNYFKKEA
ncbi:MAG: response regulator [[Eubacterium] siraeum]